MRISACYAVKFMNLFIFDTPIIYPIRILRDIDELKKDLVIERIGGDFGGEWKVLKKKK